MNVAPDGAPLLEPLEDPLLEPLLAPASWPGAPDEPAPEEPLPGGGGLLVAVPDPPGDPLPLPVGTGAASSGAVRASSPLDDASSIIGLEASLSPKVPEPTPEAALQAASERIAMAVPASGSASPR